MRTRANENRRGKISRTVAIARGWACGRKRKHRCSRKFTRCAAVVDFNFSLPNGIFAGACCATALLCKLLRRGEQLRSPFQNRLQDEIAPGEIAPSRGAGMCRGKQHLGIDMNRSALEKFIMRSHGESSNRN